MTINNGLNKYGVTAVTAAALAVSKGLHPLDAWKAAAVSVFPDSIDSRVKGCPKSAFLGLAEAGLLTDIPPGKYTSSTDNKRYALDALGLLILDARLADQPMELWRRVLKGQAKKHNSQMNVVIALWKAGRFKVDFSKDAM